MWLILILLLATVVAAGVWWLRRTRVVVTVRGVSMQPTYHAGDRVLVRRRPLTAVHPGQVVVLRAEDMEVSTDQRWIIKRVVAVPGDPILSGQFPIVDRVVPAGSLLLVGDNLDWSGDSRQHGYYRGTQLLGVVTRSMTRPG